MLQAALTTHDIDADSAIWTSSSIITDDRSSCRCSDDEKVGECVYVNHNASIVSEKVCNCANADNIYVAESSKSSSVMPAVHIHNFENVSVAEEIVHLKNHANCLHLQTKLCAHS